jgi:hypothetical protein
MKIFYVLFLSSIFFLFINCQTNNFDTVISGTLSSSSNKDNGGYYWADYYFTPVYGSTYTATVSATPAVGGFHFSVNDITKTSTSIPGTLTYHPSIGDGIFVAHVSVYSQIVVPAINYKLTISKK